VEITGYKDKHEYINKNGITSVVYLMDCMDLLKQIPEKYFELAIVDPPYGLDSKSIRGAGKLKDRIICNVEVGIWNIRPKKEYFEKLFEVSKNQIIWGGNYFRLPATRCVICWDKCQPWENFSQWEMAWTSFDSPASLFKFDNRTGDKIHPTQKPQQLYEWLIKNYAKEGDKILDTHLGSGSSRIAADKANLPFAGCELDPYYFYASIKRFNEYSAQQTFF
jgi:site-specific DNA-methyltransferase (adenine-specific)